MSQRSPLPKVVVGIPGRWPGRSDIVTSIASNSGGYLFAGAVLMHIESQWSCSLEIYDHDPAMRHAFEVASAGTIPEAELTAIAQHTHTLYLVANGGSFETGRELMRAAKALLDCGGIAVKIESTGVAHSAERWIELTDNELPHAVMWAFVTYIGDSGEYYSCGMHNLGFRDVVVTADIEPDDAASLIDQFLQYIVFEELTILDNQTFALDKNAPRYQVTKSPCTMFPPDDLFHNPYGVWELVPE